MKNTYTNSEYSKHVTGISPKSNFFKNLIFAFIFGGIICMFGQFILNLLSAFYIKQVAGDIMIMIMIFIGALLTGIGVYDDIGKYAGAGSIVPITGFANSIVSPAMEFRSEGFVFGVGAKMFAIAGPVLVYGLITSVIIGIIYSII